MRLTVALVPAMATVILASPTPPSYGYDIQGTKTMTTYTTVATCPVTSTVTIDGSTSCATSLTTYTVVVTDCDGCEGGDVTVTQPDVVHSTTVDVFTTFTTLCPVTATVTEHGQTVYKTTYETSTVTEKVHKTIVETARLPDTTQYEKETEYVTYTTTYPITKTTTENGNTVTVVYTTTVTTTGNSVPVTIMMTSEAPDTTKTLIETQMVILTSLIPTTSTVVVHGSTLTHVGVVTSFSTTYMPTTIFKTYEKPDVTVSTEILETNTLTSKYVVTQYNTVNGSTEYVTHTSTSVAKTLVPTTISKYISSDVTKIVTAEKLQTTTCYTTIITTIVSGSTVCLTETRTKSVEAVVTNTVTEKGPVVTHYSEVMTTVTVPSTHDYTTTISGSTIIIPTTKSLTTTVKTQKTKSISYNSDSPPSPYSSDEPGTYGDSDAETGETTASPAEEEAAGSSLVSPVALLCALMAAFTFF